MISDPDDDAFRWEGDPQSQRDAPPRRTGSRAPGLPDGFTPVGRGSAELSASQQVPSSPAEQLAEAAPEATPEAGDQRAPMGSAALVAFGVIGGIYGLWTIGWILGGLGIQGVAGFLVAPDGQPSPLWSAGNVVAVWLAALAPAIWFATVVALTRGSRAWLRWLLLGLGAILLVPWPLLMVGVS